MREEGSIRRFPSIPGSGSWATFRTGGRSLAQMYSSAIAPSRHLATVTMRLPSSNSPMAQVHSSDPKPIG